MRGRLHFTCEACGTAFTDYHSHAWRRFCSIKCSKRGRPSPYRGRKSSSETKAKLRAAKLGRRGPTHWNWRGGPALSTERHYLMQQDEYKQWRLAVFARDGYTCHSCGQHGGYLQADHIEPWASAPDLRYDVTNGRTLCRPCHLQTDTWGGRTRLVGAQ